jgi:hypothetical protein
MAPGERFCGYPISRLFTCRMVEFPPVYDACFGSRSLATAARPCSAFTTACLLPVHWPLLLHGCYFAVASLLPTAPSRCLFARSRASPLLAFLAACPLAIAPCRHLPLQLLAHSPPRLPTLAAPTALTSILLLRSPLAAYTLP